MKRVIFSMLAFLTIFLALETKAQQISADELFGTGTALTIQTAHAEAGIVYTRWPGGGRFAFLFGDVDGRGYIVQVWGQRMEQYGPYINSNHWLFYYERQDSDLWSGRIEFRGHFRPFCGGAWVPTNCMWK